MTDASARPIRCHMIVNAAGPWAGEIAKKVGSGKKFLFNKQFFKIPQISLGHGPGLLSVPVPVKARKRSVFVVHASEAPTDLPMMVCIFVE